MYIQHISGWPFPPSEVLVFVLVNDLRLFSRSAHIQVLVLLSLLYSLLDFISRFRSFLSYFLSFFLLRSVSCKFLFRWFYSVVWIFLGEFGNLSSFFISFFLSFSILPTYKYLFGWFLLCSLWILLEDYGNILSFFLSVYCSLSHTNSRFLDFNLLQSVDLFEDLGTVPFFLPFFLSLFIYLFIHLFFFLSFFLIFLLFYFASHTLPVSLILLCSLWILLGISVIRLSFCLSSSFFLSFSILPTYK